MIRKIAVMSLLMFICQLTLADQEMQDLNSVLENANLGDVVAQVTLSGMYLRGRGVAADNKQAEFWADKAAEKGNGYGQLDIGRSYEGQNTLAGNQAAIYWYTKASEHGVSDASLSLSGMYKGGYSGIQPDQKKSEYFNAKFSEQYDAEMLEEASEYTPPAKDSNDKPVPYKKGFYISSFVGSKRGGAASHEELYQLIKSSPDFSGADIFCVKGLDPAAILPPAVRAEYEKNNPVPMLNDKCKGAASVSVGPYENYKAAAEKMAALESQESGNFFPKIIACDIGCKDAIDEPKEQVASNEVISNSSSLMGDKEKSIAAGIRTWIVRNWLCGKMVMAVESDHSYKVAYYDMNDNFSYSAVGYYSISGSDITFTDQANRVVGGDVSHTMHVTNYFPPTDDTAPKMIYESSGMSDLECVGVRLKAPIPSNNVSGSSASTLANRYAENIANTINVNNSICTPIKQIILGYGSNQNMSDNIKILAVDKAFDKAYDIGCVVE